MNLLENEIATLKAAETKTLSGRIAFELYDTFGFPFELTEEVCLEEEIRADREGFDKEMEAQRERARASSKVAHAVVTGGVYDELYRRLGDTPFTGYVSAFEETRVEAIVFEGREIDEADSGREVFVSAALREAISFSRRFIPWSSRPMSLIPYTVPEN